MPGGRQQRRAQAQPWYCKWCEHKPTGTPWINRADHMWCGQCGLPKGSAFKGHPPAKGPPATRSPAAASARELALTKQLAEMQKRVDELAKGTANGGGAADAGGTEPPAATPPWAKTTDERKRLDDINNFLKSSLLGDTEMDRQVRAQYVKERDELQGRLEAAKPLEKNVDTLSNKLKEARREQTSRQSRREAAEAAVEKAQQALEKARSDEAESTQTILELETRLRGVIDKATPNSSGAPKLTDVVSGLGTTVEQLGNIVQSLGGGEQFAADLATMAACIGRFKEGAAAAEVQAPEQAPQEPQHAAPEAAMQVDETAQGSVDELDAATCRQHLRSCGIEVPVPSEGVDDDPAPLREQLKRQLSSFYSVHKKLKKADSA